MCWYQAGQVATAVVAVDSWNVLHGGWNTYVFWPPPPLTQATPTRPRVRIGGAPMLLSAVPG